MTDEEVERLEVKVARKVENFYYQKTEMVSPWTGVRHILFIYDLIVWLVVVGSS